MENGNLVANGHETMNGHAAVNGLGADGQAERFADNIADSTPLSHGQRRFWFFEQMEPGNPLHHLACLVRLAGPIDPAALEASLAAIVERHEVLRSSFVHEGGEPVQVAARAWSFRLARTDLSAVDPVQRENVLARLAREDAGVPFDLQGDLLLRAHLVCLDGKAHALVLVLHRIAADDMSLSIVLRELEALYEAFSTGTLSSLPELPDQYASHAIRQREHLQGETLQRLLDFWRDRMAGAPPVIPLPLDHHRSLTQSHSGASATMIYPPALLAKINEFSRAHRTTLFMTLLTAFKALLSRYTGQDDIVVGSPLSGRTRPETEGLIGLFTNTLVLRTNLGGDPTFLELLARVSETTLAAGEHQELPFEKLIEELHPQPDPSYEPVCQVGFSMKTTPASVRLAGMQGTVEPVRIATSRMDLMVFATEEPSGLRVCVEYNPDLFDAETADRLLGHFLTVLEGAVADPERRISVLPLLTPEEHTRILYEWNRTESEYPKYRYVHQLFEEQVARTPKATALIFNDTELSYAKLNRMADRLAAKLRSLGAGPDTLVAICADRSPEMVAGLMAILKSGAAYVPLDPGYPKDRLAFMVEDTQAPVVLTQRHLQGLFPDRDGLVFIEEELAAPEGQTIVEPFLARPECINGVSRPRASATPWSSNLAYVLYTSGSTGRPKGVMVTHRNVVNFFHGMDLLAGREPGVWLAVTSISFDISVLEIFWTLARGFKVIILSDQAGLRSSGSSRITKDAGRSIDEQLARHDVTHLQCTPSFARMLTRMPATLAALRPLRCMLVGGEALAADMAETLAQAIDGDFINVYGPTEMTVWCTTHTVKSGAARSSIIDIGRPTANNRLYILDRNRQPVPVGIPGELYIAGEGMGRGYWRRPELTAERFITHTFATGETARLYRTGDLVRYRSDGVVEFLGRTDHQVKIRGHRIELGEIEATLAQHPDVQQCVMVVRTDDPNNPRLTAYVIPRQSEVQEPNTLRDFLREKLPAYMVPEFFVFLERLPLTPSGKIDRNALPPPGRDAVPETHAEAAPLVGMEKAIATIWEEVLETKNPGPNDNFFDFGGHSIQVVEVQNRLQASLGIDLPVIKLFQYPTIRSLADFIGAEKKEDKEEKTFLSGIQQRAQRRQRAMNNSRRNRAEVKA